jgi:hypothetical protein
VSTVRKSHAPKEASKGLLTLAALQIKKRRGELQRDLARSKKARRMLKEQRKASRVKSKEEQAQEVAALEQEHRKAAGV